MPGVYSIYGYTIPAQKNLSYNVRTPTKNLTT